jgi:hypothetical protein
MAAVHDALAVNYEQLPAAVERIRNMTGNAGTAMFADGVYNMLGNVLVGAGNWDMTRYGLKIADVEGVRRVTLLAADSRSRQISAARMGEQLATPSIRNPYDGKPFVWNAKTESIVFTGLGDGNFPPTQVLY